MEINDETERRRKQCRKRRRKINSKIVSFSFILLLHARRLVVEYPYDILQNVHSLIV